MAFNVHKGNRTSPFRKDKERISRRFQMNLEAIIAKYDRPFTGSDVLDLNDMTIVEDQGFIGSMKCRKIGTIRLAADKPSSHSCPGTNWNSTKDSTDSAFGSTRYSESEDTSGTETIANYSFQGTRFAGDRDGKRAEVRLEDIWMRGGSCSDDSGNEDVESDRSGPICTPSKCPRLSPSHGRGNREAARGSVPLSAHRSSRGNLSRRFDAEEKAEPKRQTSRVRPCYDDDDEDEEEAEEGDNDPYKFREEELPSILEEKNRFLSKMQSILVESFIDGDDIDEMESQTDDDEAASTGTIESSEATSGSTSAWSTLSPKTTSKRSSRPPRRGEDLNLDKARYRIPALDTKMRPVIRGPPERCTTSSTDSDFTECSTILAGNLHSERVVFRPSHLLQGANRNRDSVRKGPIQPPFQAICNSTMLGEVNSSSEAVPKEKPAQQSRRLELPLRCSELPLNGQDGEMCLGDVPLSDPSNVKPHALDKQVNRTPKRGTDNESVNSAKAVLPADFRECNRESESTSDGQLGRTIFRTPSTRSGPKEDSIRTAGDQDTSGCTPRAKLRKVPGQHSPISLSSPRFDTKEIMEIFRSPKPLVIPGVDLRDLDLTPRRRVKQEGAPTPTRSLRNALQSLRSPKAGVRVDRSCGLGSQTAKEIRPRGRGLADETALGCADLSPTTSMKVERSDVDMMANRVACLGDLAIKHDKSFEGVIMLSPDVSSERRRSPRLKENSSISYELPNRPVQRNQTRTPASPAVTNRGKSKVISANDRAPNSRSDQTGTGASPLEGGHARADPPESVQRDSRGPANKKPSSSAGPVKTHMPLRGAGLDDDGDLDPRVVPAPRESAPRSSETRVEKSLQPARPARQSTRADGTHSSLKTTRAIVSMKTPSMPGRAQEGPLAPTTRGTPSTLSPPLNHLSSSSTPRRLHSQKKGKLSADPVTGLHDPTKDGVEAAEQTKFSVGNPRSKSRKSNKAKLDATHMTILQSDDDFKEEMDVDPYSLTADDSSPGPGLYPLHRRLQLDPAKKSNPKSVSRDSRHRDRVKSSEHSEEPWFAHSKGYRPIADGEKPGPKKLGEGRSSTANSAKVPLTGSSRNSHDPRDSEKPVALRGFDASDRNSKTHSVSRKEQSKARSIHRSNPSTPPPSPVRRHLGTRKPSGHDQSKNSLASSKVAVRREHSQYFSEEEDNSSGDSAKFVSSTAHRRELCARADLSQASGSRPRPRHGKPPRLEEESQCRHKTTIRCGQIVTTPTKGFKAASPGSRKTHSPSRRVRMEKTTEELYPTSPVKTFRKADVRTDRSALPNPARSNLGRTPNLKHATGESTATPPSRRGNVRAVETSRADTSSPLRASRGNVSSSYVCEGPGRCTKPFCFSCALSGVSRSRHAVESTDPGSSDVAY